MTKSHQIFVCSFTALDLTGFHSSQCVNSHFDAFLSIRYVKQIILHRANQVGVSQAPMPH